MAGTSSMPNPIVKLFMDSEPEIQMEALKWFVRHFWTAMRTYRNKGELDVPNVA